MASLCAGVVYAAGTVPPAVEDAVNAGKTMPIPDFDVITKGEDVTDFVKNNTGNTEEIEALRQNGQGVLYDPGRAEADACWSRNDPKCLAVQMVDKGSTNRPKLDPDEADKILGGRDDVIDNADDWVDLGGNGSSAGNCEDHITVIPKPEETLTCEVRTNREPGSSVEETCESALTRFSRRRPSGRAKRRLRKQRRRRVRFPWWCASRPRPPWLALKAKRMQRAKRAR